MLRLLVQAPHFENHFGASLVLNPIPWSLPVARETELRLFWGEYSSLLHLPKTHDSVTKEKEDNGYWVPTSPFWLQYFGSFFLQTCPIYVSTLCLFQTTTGIHRSLLFLYRHTRQPPSLASFQRGHPVTGHLFPLFLAGNTKTSFSQETIISAPEDGWRGTPILFIDFGQDTLSLWSFSSLGNLERRLCLPSCSKDPHSALVSMFEREVKDSKRLPGWLVVKNLPASAGDTSLISGSGKYLGEGNGNSLQYSHLRNPLDRGAW